MYGPVCFTLARPLLGTLLVVGIQGQGTLISCVYLHSTQVVFVCSAPYKAHHHCLHKKQQKPNSFVLYGLAYDLDRFILFSSLKEAYTVQT